MKAYSGIDIGSSATKVVVIDETGEIIGYSIQKTGFSYEKVAKKCFDEALCAAGISDSEEVKSVTTGYGRRNTPITDVALTEISCLSKGAYYYYPKQISIIDIGGQDNKMIQLNGEGRRVDFQLNRKCAAGTGSFLEEISNRLDISIAELHRLATQSKKNIVLGSYCTVFTFSEILTYLEQGTEIQDLARGIMFSIVKRIYELGIQTGDVVLTGGVVHHNRLIVDLLEEEFKVNVLLPPHPQLVCAHGAALHAREQQLQTAAMQ